jgi:hypothetical protein
MDKKNIALIIGLGLLGAIGAGAGVSKMKKRSIDKKSAEKKEPEKPDTPPGIVTCATCGNKYKEYEFFCPACKAPAEETAAL